MKYFNLGQISDYILKKYPESCFSVNYKNNCLLDYSMTLYQAQKFFYSEKLQWCCCGAPEFARRAVRDYLTALEEPVRSLRCEKFKEFFNATDIYDNDLLLCLAYTLDAAGLTEHGSSIGGGWLTDEGEMYLDILTSVDDLACFDDM